MTPAPTTWWSRLGDRVVAPARRRLLYLVLGLAVVGLGANMVRRAHTGSSAFTETYRYGQQLVHDGVNVYEVYDRRGTHGKYPPFFFLFAAPFTALPLGPGAALWYLANLLAAAAAAWLSVAALRPPGATPPGRLGPWIPLLLVVVLVVSNLQRGQVNLVVLAILCLGLFLAARGRDLRAGLVLGVAVALKLTPALLVAWFVWKRAWKVGIGAAASLAVCWALLPLLAFGALDAAAYTRSWAEIVAGFAQEGAAGEGLGGFRSTNQSLSAAVHRFATEVPAVQARGDRPAFYVNVLALDPRSPGVEGVVKGLSLLLLLGLAWFTRGPLRRDDRRALVFGREVSLVLIATLVVSPVSWINHFVALLFPFAVAAEAVRRLPADDPARRRRVRGVAVACLLVSSGAVVWPLAFSIPLLGAVWLAAHLARPGSGTFPPPLARPGSGTFPPPL